MSVVFYANGRLICTAQRQPFACPWDPGDAVRRNQLRVVATLSDAPGLGVEPDLSRLARYATRLD